MGSISKIMGIPPDIVEGATIVKNYGDEYAVIENYKSIIEYTEHSVKLQGKQMKVFLLGECLCIDSFDAQECLVSGRIQEIRLVRY